MKSCLIVDDSSVVRKVARRILEDIGYIVDEAEDGQEAFDKEKTQLKEKYAARAQELLKEFEARARERGFALQVAPEGIMLIPIVNGKPLEGPEEFNRLSAEEPSANQ